MSAAVAAPKFAAGQRVEVLVTDFDALDYPKVWMAGTVESAELRPDGLTDVLVVRDRPTAGNTMTRELVGKRGGGNVRTIR